MAGLVFDSWEDAGIRLPRSGSKTYCPQCHPTRKHQKDRSLSVNVERGLFNCHNPGCGFEGRIRDDRYARLGPPQPQTYAPPPPLEEIDNGSQLPGWAVEWLATRGISQATAEAFGLVARNGKSRKLGFPVFFRGQHVNTQWRNIEEKGFYMEPGAMVQFFGLDGVWEPLGNGTVDRVEDTWIIVEGPMDLLAIREATGLTNVISVPNGADSNLDAILPPLEAVLPQVTRFLLAGDRDEPGQKLMDNLSRRLGKERCFRVTWPEDCKDANDTLLKHGADAIWRAINTARPEPIEGVIRLYDLYDAVLALRHQPPEMGVPFLNGNVGRAFRIDRGMLMVVSGAPGSGKSRVLDNVMVQRAMHQEWRWLVCSPESWPPALHAKHLMQIESGIPLHAMTEGQIFGSLDRLSEAVTLVKPDTMNVKSILETIRKGMLSTGCDGIVLDPWNRLGHQIPSGMILANYVGMVVEELKNVCQRHNVFLALAAHPRKPESAREDDGGYLVVRPYDIADSHAFYDMSDFIVTVARNKRDDSARTKLFIGKVKTEEYGDVGEFELYYDRPTGRVRDEPWA